MCYHIAFDVKLESIEDYFPELVVDSQLEMSFPTASYIDGFGHSDHPVIYFNKEDGKHHLTKMEWGFLPDSWYNISIDTREKATRFRKGFPNIFGKMEPGITMLNAAGEELLLPGKKYRDSALNRRCIAIIDGFYEWRHVNAIGKKGQTLKAVEKFPYHIHFKNGQPLIIMAGVWKPWTDTETGEHVNTFAIVTTVANALMEQVHNSKKRMPTILTRELAEEWLTDGLSEQRITEIATKQYPAKEMNAYTIAKDFRTALNPKMPFEYMGLEPLKPWA